MARLRYGVFGIIASMYTFGMAGAYVSNYFQQPINNTRIIELQKDPEVKEYIHRRQANRENTALAFYFTMGGIGLGTGLGLLANRAINKSEA